MDDIESNLSAMKECFGNHDKWVSEFQYGFGWLNQTRTTQELRPLLDEYVPQKVSALLEIAVGYGRATRVLIPYCDQLYGIDYNSNCVDFCKSQPEFRDCIFEVNDGLTIPFPGVMFDLVYSFDSMVHFDKAIVKSYVKAIKARLKPDGIVILHHAASGINEGGRSNMTKQLMVEYCQEFGLAVVNQSDERPLPDGSFNDTTSVLKNF